MPESGRMSGGVQCGDAIRKQRGFKLTPGNAAVEVVGIDHIEDHPTEN
jgi:uncharacterized protein (TIGR03435 family)